MGEKSPLEELVGDKITKDNTMFYICGWQGTIDGTMAVSYTHLTLPTNREV